MLENERIKSEHSETVQGHLGKVHPQAGRGVGGRGIQSHNISNIV